ncbi:MAG: Protoheme farnesyltransferase [Verrucomicrobiales bacterium]|jgi:protoheme IX farnesyltransferase|nr:Protoheme farnesyltransferase [Verrucomicrobiales bacterium]
MKVEAEHIPIESVQAPAAHSILLDLFKARLTLLVLLTTLVGFYLGKTGPTDYLYLFHVMFGTALLASGAAALNQYIERNHDALMKRTETRPIPAGHLTPATVLLLGVAISAGGLLYLLWMVNPLTAFLGMLTIASYLFVYTPLKRVTSLNTIIGAIPGALPPLMGWTAATDRIQMGGWILFAILFFWQLPHFLAIAWMYREEYAKGGFVMLPLVDPDGERTGRSAVSHTLGLIPVSLSLYYYQVAGEIYLLGATLLGISFLYFAVQFSRKLTISSAKRLFFASILYLPLLLILMVLNKKM